MKKDARLTIRIPKELKTRIDEIHRVYGVALPKIANESLKAFCEYVEEKKKRTKLVELLLKQPPSRTLIFVETKRGADSLDDYLYHQNFPATSIHGDRTQREREDALISFK